MLTTLLFTAVVTFAGWSSTGVAASRIETPSTLSASLADLKEYYVPGEFTRIEDELVVDAVVLANDRNGNFYKRLIVEDVTGGLEILIDQTNLHERFPVGMHVSISAQGLYVSGYAGLLQLGSEPVARSASKLRLSAIAGSMVSSYVRPTGITEVLPAIERTIPSLSARDVSRYVQLCGVQFEDEALGKLLGDTETRKPKNITLTDCDGNTVDVRTYGYANFASKPVPQGGGCVRGVYSVFGRNKQLTLVSLDDLQLGGSRCKRSAIADLLADPRALAASGPSMTISALRDLHTNQVTALPTGASVQGIVVDDGRTGSTDRLNIVLQDESARGIMIRFAEPHGFSRGDKVHIELTEGKLGAYNGVAQVNGVPIANAVAIATDQPLAIATLTISELLAQPETYESRQVRILNARAYAQQPTWGRNAYLTDGSDTVSVYTRAQAGHAEEKIPSGTVDVDAYVSEYKGSYQLVLYEGEDVREASTAGELGGSATVAVLPDAARTRIAVDFERTDVNELCADGWQNIASASSSRTWRIKEYEGNKYLEASAYKDAAESTTMWWISPPMAFGKGLRLSFDSSTAYYRHDGLSVLISTDYSGSGNPEDFTWTPLSVRIPNGDDGSNTWVSSSAVQLPEAQGTGYVAFRYAGSAAVETSTFRVDNIVVIPQ